MDYLFLVLIIFFIWFKDKCLCIVFMIVSLCGLLDGLVGVGLVVVVVGVVVSGIVVVVIGSCRR